MDVLQLAHQNRVGYGGLFAVPRGNGFVLWIAATEAAAAHGVSWWLNQRALNMAATGFPDMDKLRPRMLGIRRAPVPFGPLLQRPGHQCLETLRAMDDHHR